MLSVHVFRHFKSHYLCVIFPLFCCIGLSARAVAFDEKAFLNLMVKKGLITREEADDFLEETTSEAAKNQLEANPTASPGLVGDSLQEQATIAATAAATEAATEAARRAAEDAVTLALAEKYASPPKSQGMWYDKLKVDGYVQTRFHQQLGGRDERLDAPADRSIRSDESLLIRRARIKLLGDISDHVYMYTQTDLQASFGGSLGLAARDIYFDLAMDEEKEHRLRFGLSKVPYGWVNMQSSQNRIPMERPEALNSAVEGERDYGVYYLYATQAQRQLFKRLTREGLKGSGDYGAIALGAYNGQGINRGDLNGEPHLLARLSVPWETESGQIYEAGIGGYSGRYVVNKTAISRVGFPGNGVPSGGSSNTPSRGEFDDSRVAATFVMYPQPFGIEAEWTIGRGPQLNPARTDITTESLHGGYLQACYRMERGDLECLPFIRWNYYEGGRKFANNAPEMRINEIDIGAEFQFGSAWELMFAYTYTGFRTNTASDPFEELRGVHRLGAQIQFNF